MIDIGSVYSNPADLIAALEVRYCNGDFYSDSPALLFSATNSTLVIGDTIYVLSGNSYSVAPAGYYAMYPFNENGNEVYLQIDAQGKYVGNTNASVACNNPGDFNADFNNDFNN